MIYFTDKIKIFLRQRSVFWSIILSLSLNYYLWYLIYNFINFEKEFHILHYNAYFGIDLLGAPEKLLNIPLIGLLFLVFNLILAFIVYISKKDLNIPYFLLFASVFINFELVIYLIGIIGMEC